MSPQHHRLARGVRRAVLALGLAGSLAPAFAWAQNYAIAAGDLGTALSQFAAASGVMISFSAGDTGGLSSPGLHGDFSVEQGFARLLAGAGLQVRQVGEKRYVLVKAAEGDAVELGATTIQGRGLASDSETTGTYLANQPTRTATKLGLSVQETPQSITVITRQRMDDQKLGSLNEVLEATVGVSSFNQGIGTDLDQPYSRGFLISNYQVDGLPRSASKLYSLNASTAMYDRVEVIRGATGLMSGMGSPGAAINLVRKRPTATPQASLSAEAGSWDHYGLGADLSGPLNDAGNIRSRLVLEVDDQNSWLDRYQSRSALVYNVTEFDLGEQTLLSVGFTHQRNDNEQPLRSGVPLYYRDNFVNGQRINLPRSYNNAPDWTFYDTRETSVFAGLDQQFDNGWTGKLEISHALYDQDAISYYQYGGIDPTTGLGSATAPAKWVQTDRQDSLDAYLSGPFSLFGREHELVVGGAWSSLHSHADNYGWLWSWNSNYDGTLGNVWDWDGSGANRPDFKRSGKTFTDVKQYSAYLTSRFNLTDATHLILGSRVVDWKSDAVTTTSAGGRSKQSQKESGVVVPFGGLVYDIDDIWSLYGSYTQIFNPQNGSVRDINNQSLDPEEGSAYEAGIKAGLRDGRLIASLALFRVEQDNVAEYDGTLSAYRQLQGITTRGLELELNGELADGWNIAGGYAYSLSEDADGQRAMSRVPRHNVKAFTTYRLTGALDKLTVGGGFNWKSRYGYEGEGYPVQESVVIASAMARYQLTPQIETTLHVNNLFDRTYYASITENGVYGEPRNVVMGVKYSF